VPALLLSALAASCSSAGQLETAGAARICAAPPADPQVLAQVLQLAGEQPARVADRVDMLSPVAEQRLAKRAEALEAATTDQVVIVTVRELGGITIEEFAQTLGNHWGIGRADADNGVLLLAALGERKLRLEVGCGLENVLPDASAAEIIGKMTPYFQRSDYELGLTVGFGEVEARLRARRERRRERP
jgi:uncharacterized protein